MNKRANGEGSLRKRSDGRWEGRYTVGIAPETGKRISKSVFGKTQAECKNKLRTPIQIQQFYHFTKESGRVAKSCKTDGKPLSNRTVRGVALQSGIDVKTVSNMLGHYSIGCTLDTYTHVTDQIQKAAAKRMQGVMDAALHDEQPGPPQDNTCKVIEFKKAVNA